MKKQKIISYSALALLFILMSPASAHASKIFIDLPEKPISVGNTSLIKVMLDSEKEINAAEGFLQISAPKDVVSVNTGGSIFNLWPRKPSLDKDKISFTGGTTAGVYGKSLKLFTIAVKPSSTNSIKISFVNTTTFLNDGKGTKEMVVGNSVQIPVQSSGQAQNELNSLVAGDKKAPKPFTIELGRDASTYDGKYFVSFYAEDNESGVNRYEITEGKRPAVRTGNIYVLQDQNLSSDIKVSAIDNAGNVQTKTLRLNAKSYWVKMITIILLVLAVVFAIYFFIRKRKKIL